MQDPSIRRKLPKKRRNQGGLAYSHFADDGAAHELPGASAPAHRLMKRGV
jgi:hypothetical protein